jgi:hypothetical protein
MGWLGLAGLVGVLFGPAVASADTFSDWTAGPGAILDNTYTGFIDSPTMNATVPTGNFNVTGWFVDKTAQGWAGADDIEVWQGTMDGGGKMLAKATIALDRPDVAAALGNPYFENSGFGATIPSGALAAGPATLSVYAHTPGKGWWYKQVNVNVSSSAPTSPAPTTGGAPAPVSGGALPIVAIEQPANGDTLKTKPEIYTIMGYALDKNAAPNQGSQGTGIDSVQVYVDAEKDNGGTLLGDATLAYEDATAAAAYGSQFQSSGWRLDFKPTNLHAGSHTLFVYAHSVVTNKENLATTGFAVTESS